MSPEKTKNPKSVQEQFRLDGLVCLITGGAGYLGRQFADALQEMGGSPILIDIESESLWDAEHNLEYPCFIADVTDYESLVSARDQIISKFGRIDVLVNSAGLTKHGCEADPKRFFAPFENTDREVWEAGLQINLTGVMLCCQVFGPTMVEQGRGAIINIASDIGIISPDQRIYAPDEHGYEGVDFNAPAFYSASKAGVIHLTKHLAALWASNGVRVNAISPAGVFRNHDPAFVKQLASRIPMGRMANEGEFKGAVVYLASEASSFVTGHNLVIDGGRTIW
jgi:NAD(P)-dependent dehydrogenase (short-subunit alcohol dehydrogenase family)